MFHPYRAAASFIDRHRYRAVNRARRFYRAWCYAVDQLDADTAQTILLDCRRAAGWHPLLTLTLEDTLKEALETWADSPDLRRLIADGCARVEAKWEVYNDDLADARRWAIETAQGYAAAEGIKFVLCDTTPNDAA